MCWISKSSGYFKYLTVSLLIFSFCLSSQSALAKYSGGSGTATDPYRIRTVADWQTFMVSPSDWNLQFILLADIDLQGISLTPVGSPFPQTLFFGTFDGSGHTISNANMILPNNDNVGLFGNLGINGQIRNLGLKNVTINGRNKVGALVGYNWAGNIINCYSTGFISASMSAGGLVGENFQGTIAQSYAMCAVSSTYEAGGLIGYNNNGTLTQCYSIGPVSGNLSVGGLVGDNTAGTITQCYSTSEITGSYNTGGLVGYNDNNIAQSYSSGTVTGDDFTGALVGYNQDGLVTQCYSTASASGNFDAGALVGFNNLGTISKCYSKGTVSGGLSIGGLVGENSAGIITECYSTTSVNGGNNAGGLVGNNSNVVLLSYSASSVTGNANIGGLVGLNSGDVNDCYSTGNTDGSEYYVGGLIGENDGNAVRCYSISKVTGGNNVGGLVGFGLGSIKTSVWDMETSGLAGSSGGVGLPTEKMMDTNMLGLNGFASDPNWILDAGNDYPRLAWEGTPGQIIPEPAIDWLEGAGTELAPYKIDTAEQLILAGKAGILWDSHFVLDADIYLDPNLVDLTLVDPNLTNKLIFGQAVIPSFGGVFDGNDHIISSLTIKGGSFLGLFGKLEPESIIKNLAIEDVNIIGSGRYIGGLAGYSDNCKVSLCASQGIVNGYDSVGGLTGYNQEGSIAQSYSTGIVSASISAGGLVGENLKGSVIQSYSTSSVSGIYQAGGLVGYNWDGSITQCYSTGAVNGNVSAGGLVGENLKGTINQCYSTGSVSGEYDTGGLVGISYFPNNITQSFWDMKTSGKTSSSGGTGKTTSQMKTQNTFTNSGWDFADETTNGSNDLWWILEGQSYPRLFWELNQ